MRLHNLKRFIHFYYACYFHKKKHIQLLKEKFQRVHGYELNLYQPKTFNEKILFRMIYGNFNFMYMISDKLLVRNYVKEILGDKYLIPVYRRYDKVSFQDIIKLPDQFVIKTNHASGPDFMEIVFNKKEINIKNLINKMNYAVCQRFGIDTDQLFYDKIKPCIFVEKLLTTEKEKIPKDYKIHCFRPNVCILEIIIKTSLSQSDKKFFWFDDDLNEITGQKSNEILEIKNEITIIKKMKHLAKKFLRDFDYIRVDFYCLEGNIYFGELTLTHGNGFSTNLSKKFDEDLGKKWLVDYKNKKLYKLNNPLNS